jgi:hypothetical protein
MEDVQEFVFGPRIQGLRLEPNTDTVFTAQYLATPGRLYAVAFTLPSRIATKHAKPWEWSKWRAVYVPKPDLTGVQAERSFVPKPADAASRVNSR